MPNFPTSLDDDASLFLAVNNLRTTLTSSISDSDLTIPVITTSGFPNTGFITILSDPDDITKAEAISYEGYTATTFSGTQRGAGGTPALPHDGGDNVDLTIVAAHHNELKDAVIALENFVGIEGSENFFRVNAGVITTATGTFTESLTISGTPVSLGGGLTVQETDGTPTVSNVNTIVVTTGTLTDNGGGQVTIATGGGGGGASADEGLIVFLSQVFS